MGFISVDCTGASLSGAVGASANSGDQIEQHLVKTIILVFRVPLGISGENIKTFLNGNGRFELSCWMDMPGCQLQPETTTVQAVYATPIDAQNAFSGLNTGLGSHLVNGADIMVKRGAY